MRATDHADWPSTDRFYCEVIANSSAKVIEKQGIKTSIEVIGHKSLAQGIIDMLEKSEVDVIVRGTKGLTGVGKFVTGGIARTADKTQQ